MSSPTAKDWHPADVMAALRKLEPPVTFRSLSFANGYNGDAVGETCRKHAWPAVERIVAQKLGLKPQQIWPSRYNADGTPKRRTSHPLKGGRRRRKNHVSSRSAA